MMGSALTMGAQGASARERRSGHLYGRASRRPRAADESGLVHGRR